MSISIYSFTLTPAEDHFLVGYGLDYAEQYRNLDSICALKETVYQAKKTHKESGTHDRL